MVAELEEDVVVVILSSASFGLVQPEQLGTHDQVAPPLLDSKTFERSLREMTAPRSALPLRSRAAFSITRSSSPPLDDLLRRLRDHRQGFAAIGRTDSNPWLFPGGHLSSRQLLRSMQSLGIRARPARNTTLIELAADLPAVVLSQLLNHHLSTATRWATAARSPAADYAADLLRRADR